MVVSGTTGRGDLGHPDGHLALGSLQALRGGHRCASRGLGPSAHCEHGLEGHYLALDRSLQHELRHPPAHLWRW
jgi:hypothetical protein